MRKEISHSFTRLRMYLRVARLDHWFKNLYVFTGSVSILIYPEEAIGSVLLIVRQLLLAFILACLASSANYMINEIIDGPRDLLHPVKKYRPVPSGLVSSKKLWIMAGVFATVSLAGAIILMSIHFVVTLLFFLIIGGIVYNVPPIRTKDIVYLDVLSESINGPIRLFLGWFALTTQNYPPLLLTLACWFFPAFLMTSKRYVELLFIGDSGKAAAYRTSFKHYTEKILLRTMVVYIILTVSIFLIFIFMCAKYQLFILIPFFIIFIFWFFHLVKKRGRIIREPEHIWEESGFTLYCISMVLLSVILVLL